MNKFGRIAITGGSGSLGSALIERLDMSDTVVTFTRDEAKRREMQQRYPHVKVYAGDVRDRERMADIFCGCDAVVHAAARKVVSGHWDEPRELLKTNVEGTVNVLAAAREAGVKKVLFVSSDKAVHAENAYGVSKAMGEHLVVSENARSYPKGTACSVLRYGNVIGSRGSVLPLWCSMVNGALRFSDLHVSIPVTSMEMTRFWVPMDDAVQFVRHSLSAMQGGEVFVPVLRSASMSMLFQCFADSVRDVCGLECHREEVGVRPGGEKKYEELLSADEMHRTFRSVVSGHEMMAVLPHDGPDSWNTRFPEPYSLIPFAIESYRSDTWMFEHTHGSLLPLVKAIVERDVKTELAR